MTSPIKPRTVTRVSRYRISRPGSLLSPDAKVTITEQWDSGRFNGKRHSAKLTIHIDLENVQPPTRSWVAKMEDHLAEWTGGTRVVFIANKLIEVRPRDRMKGHNVGRLIMNAMVIWAKRYHPDGDLVPISTTVNEPIGSKLISFYGLFGMSFPINGKSHSKSPNPMKVHALTMAAAPYLSQIGDAVLTVRR